MKIKWPINAEMHAYMAGRQRMNRVSCLKSKAEAWIYSLLKPSGLTWTRQAQWGYRLFDFWCAELGIAVEVDGPEHKKNWDAFRDDHNYRVSGILVIRIPNFDNAAAANALIKIGKSTSWNERRASLGLDRVDGGDRKVKRRGRHRR